MDKETSVAIVTGASGVIGRAIAVGMAERGFEVVLVCRDRWRGERARAEVREHGGSKEPRLEIADLSRRAEIRALAKRWRGPLHVLVNNAAIAPRRRMETAEGIELQFATNVLGYFWLTLAFEPVLRASSPARVVNVASYWAGGLDLGDLDFRRRAYDNNAAYRQSKQANRMLTVVLAERLQASGVTVNACHPGDANSRLSNDLGFGGSATPEEAAATPIWLATERSLARISGRYFVHKRAATCEFAHDRATVVALYDLCCNRQTG
jgi:retinol dehydrogenase-13